MYRLLLAALLLPAAAAAGEPPASDCLIPATSPVTGSTLLLRCAFKVESWPLFQSDSTGTTINRAAVERLAVGPSLAAALEALPGVTRTAEGQLRVRDLQPWEQAVIIDGVWLPGAAIGGALSAHPSGVIPPAAHPRP